MVENCKFVKIRMRFFVVMAATQSVHKVSFGYSPTTQVMVLYLFPK